MYDLVVTPRGTAEARFEQVRIETDLPARAVVNVYAMVR